MLVDKNNKIPSYSISVSSFFHYVYKLKEIGVATNIEYDGFLFGKF